MFPLKLTILHVTCTLYILHGLQGALVREHGTATSQEDSASGRGTVASPVHRHET